MKGVLDHVRHYLALDLRPMPMWGVTESGACLCGGWGQRRDRPCNPGKHSQDEEAWKAGRAYGPDDFSERDNVAIALGPYRAGLWLVCLDVDGPLPAEHFFPELPATMTQLSPRGRHLFYTVPAYTALGNWVDCLATKDVTGTAVDVRYARGRINVAPSRSAFGAYRWSSRLGDPAPLPWSVLQTIESSRRRRGLPVHAQWQRDGKRP